jgi:hypothetical protein
MLFALDTIYVVDVFTSRGVPLRVPLALSKLIPVGSELIVKLEKSPAEALTLKPTAAELTIVDSEEEVREKVGIETVPSLVDT